MIGNTSIPPVADLREMLRLHLKQRSLACLEAAEQRRTAAMDSGDVTAYRQTIRAAVRSMLGTLPVGAAAARLVPRIVSSSEQAGFRIENVLFESHPGWQVNATVYIPTSIPGPHPAVIVPVGHSGKQLPNYQLPCQYFALSGFIAVCFDPPGQASERQSGNDHFRDGVRDYLLGRCSSRYFVADALRCLDYLETRQDADLSHGVAMTGVSGGGTTTTFAALLDDRITVIGPSCCLSPLADLDINQGYCGCPETHHLDRYRLGVDEVDLLCAAAPTRCLLMAGETDEVFHIADTRRLAKEVACCYKQSGAAEQFSFFADPGGHAYTLLQAESFASVMAEVLCPETSRGRLLKPGVVPALLPYEAIQCHPDQGVNMRTRAVIEAADLASARDRDPAVIRQGIRSVLSLDASPAVPTAVIGEPFQVWMHDWRSISLRSQPGIELPASLLVSRSGVPSPAILHFDDAGRHREMQRYGLLAGAMRLYDRTRPVHGLLSVDLRGWGDSAPAMHPYELASWGGIDRSTAYMANALGDPLMAMRCRDALAAYLWLKSRPEIDPQRIVITASGLGAIPALHVAALEPEVAGVVAWGALSSFESLIAAESYPWPADAFMGNALLHYDLPDLAEAARCPISLHGLLQGDGATAGTLEYDRYTRSPHVHASTDASRSTLAGVIDRMLSGEAGAHVG